MTILFLLWSALGFVLGVFTFVVAERERKRGAPLWSWMPLFGFGTVLLSFGLLWLLVLVSS